MKTQTAVDVLSSFLKTHCNPSVCDIEWSDLETAIREAKAMEKEQSKNDYVNGMYKGQEVYFGECVIRLDVNHLPYCEEVAEKYYNETFGGDK